MGLLDVIQAPFLDEPEASIPDEDFPAGLRIEELPESGTGLMCILVNHMLPEVPFSFGGEQHVVKEYYAGNDLPATQILGSREDDITFHGKLRDRRFAALHKDMEFSKTIAELLQDIRRRGFLCKLTLGDYVWHGFLTKTHFDMKTTRDYKYELTFSVIALRNIPDQCPVIGATFDEMALAHDQVAAMAAELASKQSSIPASVPLSIGDALNKAIGGVASVVSGVTSYVDAILTNVSDIQNSVTRAVGLVTNAKTQAFKWGLQLGQISHSLQLAGVKVDDQYKLGTYVPESTYQGYKSVAQIQASKFITGTISTITDTVKYLDRLKESFSEVSKTVPIARYMVKADDETLQQISSKFYGTVDH